MALLATKTIEEIHSSMMVLPPGILYCKRLANPTRDTISYGVSRLLHESTQHNVHHLIWDIRGRGHISGGLQLHIAQQIPKISGHFQHVSVVWDDNKGNALRRAFIKKMPVFHKDVSFEFHTSIEDAMAFIQKLVDQ